MNKNLLILLSAFSSVALFSQKIPSGYNELIRVADSLYRVKDYKNSAIVYSSAFKAMGWKGTEHDRYKAAQAWALANIPDSAFFCLNKIAFTLYYDNYDEINNEDDFKSLRSDKRWLPLLKQVQKNKLPDRWDRRESKPLTYRIYIEDCAGQNSGNAATIKSIVENTGGFGNLMQSFSAGRYKGKRIRMTGYMKTKDVADWAGFWLRIDGYGSDKKKQLAFDNMRDGNKNRSITGTNAWKKYDIVLDVSEEATDIVFGALLSGTGQIWFEKIKFDIVDNSVPTTARAADEPNLDFNK